MFCKLALRNVRRSFRDYGVYLLTLTFGVCLFYTFSSLDGQGAMIYLTQSQNPMAQVIQSCIDVFSVFVAVVLACLILYADRFLMRRRKRELGTYLLLGLSQGQVSLLLVLETGLIGAAALMRPSKSCQDMEVSSLKKKFKDKKFAAGCSRDVIKTGAERLGWTLEELMEKTLQAQRSCEESVAAQMAAL